MTLSQRLRDWRKQEGLDQGAAGKRIGVTQASFSRYESGLQKPEPSTLDFLEKITGIPREVWRPDIFTPQKHRPRDTHPSQGGAA